MTRTEALMHRPDNSLLTRFRAGELDALEQVYGEYENLIYRHAYHILGHVEDAHDVRQDTFLRAYNARKSFRGEASLKTWLLRICTNLCISKLRDTKRHGVVSYDAENGDRLLEGFHTEDPLAEIERLQTASLIHKAIQALPASYRVLIVMREIDELSFDEMAGILGCTIGSVPVKLFRARNLLRQRVQALMAPGD